MTLLLLGERDVTRQRYAAPGWAAGRDVPATPTEATIRASVTELPRAQWLQDATGKRTRRTIRVYTYADLQGAEAGGAPPDRLVVGGRTYEVVDPTVWSEFEGDPDAHTEALAVEVQPITANAGTPVAPAIAAMAILGDRGGVLTAVAANVTGTGPVTIAWLWQTSPVDAGIWTDVGALQTIADPDSDLDIRVLGTPTGGTGLVGAQVASQVYSGGGAAPEPPINTAAPLLSGMSGGGAAVGDSLALSDGTWDPAATSYTKQYTRGGVDISGATSSPYVPVASDAGATIGGYVYGINDDGTSVLPGVASNPQVIRPYWTAPPVISSGSQPWPGGTVTGTDGSVAGATTSAREWTLNGTGTGDLDGAYNPVVGNVGALLRRAGSASNSGGDSTGSNVSDPVTIVQVEGLTRPSTSSQYLQRSVAAIGSAGAIIVRCKLTSAASGIADLLTLGRDATNPNRYGISPRIVDGSPPTLRGSVYHGPNTPDNRDTGIELPGALTGTEYIIIMEWTGGTAFTLYAAAAGAESYDTDSWTAAGSPAHSTAINATLWRTALAAAAASGAGAVEGVILNRVTTPEERAAILAADNLADSAIFAASGAIAIARPVGSVAVAGSNTTGAGVTGTWALAGTGAAPTYGGFNVAVP